MEAIILTMPPLILSIFHITPFYVAKIAAFFLWESLDLKLTLSAMLIQTQVNKCFKMQLGRVNGFSPYQT